MSQRAEITSFSEEYLQISPNILASFPKFRPPVSLYFFKPETNMVQLYAKQEERVSKTRQEEVAALCGEGQLFLSREDYRIYAQHICKKLGLILVETSLDERDIAEILYQALKMRLCEFFDQPTEPVWTELLKNITIFSEYIWIDPCRVVYLARNLHTEKRSGRPWGQCLLCGNGPVHPAAPGQRRWTGKTPAEQRGRGPAAARPGHEQGSPLHHGQDDPPAQAGTAVRAIASVRGAEHYFPPEHHHPGDCPSVDGTPRNGWTDQATPTV